MSSTIVDLRNLEENWNGHGAKPIPDIVCDRAEKFIELFKGADKLEIFPTGRESIQIEFETDMTYFEIEVFEDKYTTMFAERNGDKEYNHFEFEDEKVMNT